MGQDDDDKKDDPGFLAAGTRVEVQTVRLGLKEGRGSVQGLTVSTPPCSPTGTSSASGRSFSI